jgi:hypothetical protein
MVRCPERDHIIGLVRYDGLPGAGFIEAGIADLAEGRETIPALLVSIGAPRLRDLGLDVRGGFDNPEHRLYERLAAEAPRAAHARYNAYLQRLVSFERAAACVR